MIKPATAGPTTAADVTIAPGPAAPDSFAPAAQAPPIAFARAAAAAAPQPPPRSAIPGPRPAPVKAPIDSVSIAAGYYKIGAHKNFAEIHVRRSNGSGGDSTFAWWTEPGTALPGTDYVAPARTIQLLSERSQIASLFVRLVPNVARKHRVVFYVVIAEPGNGASLGRVTRAAVVLPAQ